MTEKTDHPENFPPLQLNHLLSGEFVLDLHDFWYARMERLNPCNASPEYESLEDLRECLFEQVRAALPDKLGEKLIKLSDTHTAMGAMATELYYRQGFSDGVMMILQAMMG